MILTIDIGNSNIVFGFVDPEQEKVVAAKRLPTDRARTMEEYEADLRGIIKAKDIVSSELEGGIVSSSVPAVTHRVKRATEEVLGKEILEVKAGINAGVNLGLEDPSQLGPDILSAAVGGISIYGTPLIILDLGTATTYSVINRDSVFMGGMIAPGVASSLEGLLARASHLPWVEFEKPRELISGDTAVAIQSGVMYGHASEIDGMVERIWEELGYETTVVATGGLSKMVAPLCKKNIIEDRDLLLKGLMILYKKNC